MVMCNKYGYAQGCYDTFYLSKNMYSNIEEIDADTANVAVRYLLKAYRKNHKQAVHAVDKYSIKYDEATNREQLIRMYR
jgi:hypothetical protein